MLAALAYPRLLDQLPDHPVMLTGSAIRVAGLVARALADSYLALLLIWFLLNIGYLTAQTPSGRLLRRSSHPQDRPALFAAQFALSWAAAGIDRPIEDRACIGKTSAEPPRT